ncbi:Nn.00g055050.m01.CDS01 [Neocucurbitaria sp. VM-36]
MSSLSQAPVTGAKIIANTLKDLGVTSIFSIVGVPISEIAEQAINIGIRFIGFRNEQAASYAATAYGYLTGKPGVCLVVGGPGVLHAIAGVGPTLLWLFIDKEPLNLRVVGTGFVDLPADIINDPLALDEVQYVHETPKVANPPRGASNAHSLDKIVELIKGAQAPLVLIGKGAAYACAEKAICSFIDLTHIPFLPSPMGKGVVRDSHANNVSSARSAALKSADVVLILGARLIWIFHHGEAPKWNPVAQFIQVDISPEEMGRNAADAELSLLGDVGVVVSQLSHRLSGWKYEPLGSNYIRNLDIAKRKNEQVSALAAEDRSIPLTYGRAFHFIKTVLHTLSPPSDGGIL